MAHHYCAFAREYAQANNLDHPRSVHVREGLIVEPLDDWPAQVFDPTPCGGHDDVVYGGAQPCTVTTLSTAQGEYELVHPTVKNIGNEAQFFSDSALKFIDSKDRKYDADSGVPAPALKDSNALQPWQFGARHLLFDVPKASRSRLSSCMTRCSPVASPSPCPEVVTSARRWRRRSQERRSPSPSRVDGKRGEMVIERRRVMVCTGSMNTSC
jgi:hypothetical protein